MIEGQTKPVQLRCPRCGGLMQKAPGSTLYWHADNNHPRCDITNIVGSVLEAQLTQQSGPSPETPKPKNRRGK